MTEQEIQLLDSTYTATHDGFLQDSTFDFKTAGLGLGSPIVVQSGADTAGVFANQIGWGNTYFNGVEVKTTAGLLSEIKNRIDTRASYYAVESKVSPEFISEKISSYLSTYNVVGAYITTYKDSIIPAIDVDEEGTTETAYYLMDVAVDTANNHKLTFSKASIDDKVKEVIADTQVWGSFGAQYTAATCDPETLTVGDSNVAYIANVTLTPTYASDDTIKLMSSNSNVTATWNADKRTITVTSAIKPMEGSSTSVAITIMNADDEDNTIGRLNVVLSR